MRIPAIALTLLAVLLTIGCSETNNITNPGPNPNPVDSVSISPTSATFNAVGEKQQFTANAFDANGGEISATFTWASSQEEVVVIGAGGLAVATGAGSARLFVSAGGKVDSSMVTVNVGGSATVSWLAATSGDWSDATKWSGGAVPRPGDTAVIGLDGTYTVTLTGDVSVGRIVLGAPSGTQTLSTGSNRLTTVTGDLKDGAALVVDGAVVITEDVNWSAGDIAGTGTVEVEPGAELTIGGSPSVTLRATIRNQGIVALISNVVVDINGGTLDNAFGALVDFRSAAILFAFSGGSITNSGAIVRSAGIGEAAISTSAGTFVSTGRVEVEVAVLRITGGEIGGRIEIATGATLRQTSTTKLRPGTFQQGAGVFEITGRVVLGNLSGERVTLANVVLASPGGVESIGGPADLLISQSLVWRTGTMAGAGKVVLEVSSQAILEGTATKVLSERVLSVGGTLSTSNGLSWRFEEGASMEVAGIAGWTHDGGGTISNGLGATPSITITGTFTKTGGPNLALRVAPDFSCGGNLFLEAGVLVANGSFRLGTTGTIIGGGTDTTGDNERLNVVGATSATLQGTIELDADGSNAMMSIRGVITLDPTVRVLVDVTRAGNIPAERLTFLTPGVALAGTLDVNVTSFPNPGDQYRVVSTVNGTGRFDSIVGATSFTIIQEDASGVQLIRN